MSKQKSPLLEQRTFPNLSTMREGSHPRTSKPCSAHLGQYARWVNIFLPDQSMPHAFTVQQIVDLEAVLSPPRFGTYLREAAGDRQRAMDLYCWNTTISSAFYVTLQFCELSIRNGAVEAVEAVFGANWHLNRGFSHTLPVPKRGYQPKDDLAECARRLPTAGKVVAELKFAFWRHLFVKGQQARIWDPELANAFPGYDHTLTLSQARASLFDDIDAIRKFRNRIAHHEPIFSRNLTEDHQRIRRVIEWRRPGTAAWLDGVETVTRLLAERP